jgi:hypothetical protein
VVEAPRGRWEFLDKIESSDGKGPCNQDRLDLLRGDVFLLGKVLTSLISPHDVLCTWPVKPLSKGFTHQGVWSRMVITSP